jgi:hypothetical protein
MGDLGLRSSYFRTNSGYVNFQRSASPAASNFLNSTDRLDPQNDKRRDAQSKFPKVEHSTRANAPII